MMDSWCLCLDSRFPVPYFFQGTQCICFSHSHMFANEFFLLPATCLKQSEKKNSPSEMKTLDGSYFGTRRRKTDYQRSPGIRKVGKLTLVYVFPDSLLSSLVTGRLGNAAGLHTRPGFYFTESWHVRSFIDAFCPRAASLISTLTPRIPRCTHVLVLSSHTLVHAIFFLPLMNAFSFFQHWMRNGFSSCSGNR